MHQFRVVGFFREHIGDWHFARRYVRGNWRRAEEASPMTMAKACHDFDILRWLAHAPKGSAERCTDGCAVARSCPYSAPRIYLERLPPAIARMR